MSRYKDQIRDHFSKEIVSTGSVLSIGKKIDDRSYFKGFNCKEFVTLDIDRELNPDILFDINKPILLEGGFEIEDKHIGYYDMVLTLNLWEYIWNPSGALRNCFDFLKNGGMFIGTFPFIYPVHNPEGVDYLRYTPEGVKKLLTLNGFTDIEIKPILGNELLIGYYSSDELRMRKNYNHLVVGSIVIARKG